MFLGRRVVIDQSRVFVILDTTMVVDYMPDQDNNTAASSMPKRDSIDRRVKYLLHTWREETRVVIRFPGDTVPLQCRIEMQHIST